MDKTISYEVVKVRVRVSLLNGMKMRRRTGKSSGTDFEREIGDKVQKSRNDSITNQEATRMCHWMGEDELVASARHKYMMKD